MAFPQPIIPPTTILDSLTWQPGDSVEIPSVLELKNVSFTTSGRASIALALEHANINAEDEVLIPSYHCEAMIAPVRWRKANAVFYRIDSNCQAQLTDITAKLTKRTRALIVTHYFGFLQPLEAIRALCNEHSIMLIEDCAHALFGGTTDQPVGSIGDYAIASCMKFLPIYEGGLIASNNHDLTSIVLTAPSLTFQLKSMINCVEIAVFYKRLGIAGQAIANLFKIKDALWSIIKKLQQTQPHSLGPTSSEGSYGLDEAWIDKSMSFFSRWITQHAPVNQIAEQRRQNYQRMQAAFSNLPGCRPLFSKLPEQTVPWVYPLYVEAAEKYFPLLKNQGVPIIRFGEYLDSAISEAVCPVSVDYSRHVFQFPCHQSLTDQEINWLITTITETLFAPS